MGPESANAQQQNGSMATQFKFTIPPYRIDASDAVCSVFADQPRQVPFEYVRDVGLAARLRKPAARSERGTPWFGLGQRSSGPRAVSHARATGSRKNSGSR